MRFFYPPVTPASVRLPPTSEFRPTRRSSSPTQPRAGESVASLRRLRSPRPCDSAPHGPRPGDSAAPAPTVQRLSAPARRLARTEGRFWEAEADARGPVWLAWRRSCCWSASRSATKRALTHRLPPLTSARDLIVALPVSQPAPPPTRSPRHDPGGDGHQHPGQAPPPQVL